MRLEPLSQLACACLLLSACHKTPSTPGAHTDLIPRDVDAALFLDALSGIPDALRSDLSPDAARSMCARWRQRLSLDPCDRGSWAALGLDLHAPATLFSHQGQLVLLAHLSQRDRLEAWRARQANIPRRRLDTRTQDGVTWHTLRESPDTSILHIATRGDLIMFAPGPDLESSLPGLTPSLSPQPASWLPGVVGQRFSDEPNHRNLHSRLSGAPAFLIARPGVWLHGLPTPTMRARELRDRMRSESGHIGVSMTREGSTLKLRALLLEDAQEPATPHRLGHASGGLPPLGGLIAPGTLGVVRLSVEPTSLFALLYGARPPADRARLDGFLAQMREEFALDLEDALVRNLRGHAIIALYGLHTFDPGHPDFWRDLIALRATRETVYLPIRDRAKVALVLDALTQLTRGALRRKRVEGAVQYAWFDKDGELKGALLLHQDHIILIDSASAFTRAMAYTRNPEPLAPGLEPLKTLLSTPHTSGLSVDTATLRGLLPSNLPVAIKAAASAFDRVTLRVHEESGVGVAELDLVLAAPP